MFSCFPAQSVNYKKKVSINVYACDVRELSCLALTLVAARALATYLIPGCVGRGVKLGSESSSGATGARRRLEIWSEMGPYGSIWLDTAAKIIVRTLRIFFVFKKSLNKHT